jgi:hypothetical protein
MSDWYAPNQQAVRGDESGPADEGSGGSLAAAPAGPEPAAADDGLDAMTKDQLLDEAAARGVDVNAAMTKDEIKAAIRGG